MSTPAPEGDERPSRSTRDLLGLVAGALRLAWSAAPRSLVAAIAVQVGAALGATAQLLIGRWLLDEILRTGTEEVSLEEVLPAAAALVVVTTAITLASIVQSTEEMVLTERIGRQATGRVLDVAMAVEPATYDDPAFHDALERARFNATSRPVMAVHGLLGVLGAALSAAGIALALFVMEPLLVPVALLGAIPAWIAGTANSRRYHRFTRAQTAENRMRSYLVHVLSNRELAKELRVYGGEAELRRRHDALYDERVALVRRLATARRRVALGAAAAGALVLLASLTVLLWAVESGRIDLASAGTALFALLFLGQRLRTFVTSAGTLYEAALFIDDVEEYRAHAGAADPEPTAATPATTPVTLPAPDPPLPPFELLRAEHLSFTYPGADRPVLDDVELVLRRGETVALVGENGSGKTTLAKLLVGIYEPSGGRLWWDDTDLGTVPLARLRRSAAVVFQDHLRLQLTARDNVALGDFSRIDDALAVAAAGAAAGADEVVAGLPGGWDQLLSRLFDGGTDLSGGQWQRLALARALFREAPLLVMDEPSAALDARAEAALFGHIRAIAAGRTVLFISHRFSTVRVADRIYVLAGGRIVEEGTHDELVARGGHYEEMFRLQAALYGTA